MVSVTFHILDILKDVQQQGGGINALRKDERLTRMAVGELARELFFFLFRINHRLGITQINNHRLLLLPFGAESSNWTPFIPLTNSSTMLDVMLIIGKFGVHRLPVVSDDGQLINIITQSAVTEVLVKNEAAVKSLITKTLGELGFDQASTVYSVKGDDTLQSAIELLRDHVCSELMLSVGGGGGLVQS